MQVKSLRSVYFFEGDERVELVPGDNTLDNKYSGNDAFKRLVDDGIVSIGADVTPAPSEDAGGAELTEEEKALKIQEALGAKNGKKSK